MVQILVSEKGEGKTKRLIEIANEAVKNAHGHVVFIDDDNRHIYDLHYDIRFVETSDFPLSNYRELIGFIYGILSQDSDIEKIYIDGLYNIVKNLNDEDLIKLISKLQRLSDKLNIDFIATANIKPENVPKELTSLLMD